MKQFMNAEKPFWPFGENVRKCFPVKDRSSTTPPKTARGLVKQGTPDVHFPSIRAPFPPSRRLRGAGDRRHRFHGDCRSRTAAALSLCHGAGAAADGAAGTVGRSGRGRRLAGALETQIVNYPTREAAGTIIIDTPNTYLYYV